MILFWLGNKYYEESIGLASADKLTRICVRINPLTLTVLAFLSSIRKMWIQKIDEIKIGTIIHANVKLYRLDVCALQSSQLCAQCVWNMMKIKKKKIK